MNDQAPAPAISAAEVLARIVVMPSKYLGNEYFGKSYADHYLRQLKLMGFAIVPIEPDEDAMERACMAFGGISYYAGVLAALRSYTGAE